MIRYGPQMRILIVGGGIAGLSLAALLRQRCASDIDIVEKAPDYGGVGYVLGLWPAGGNVMKELGLFETLRERSRPFDHYTALDRRGRAIVDYPLQGIDPRVDDGLLIDRASLLDVLRGSLDLPIRFSTKVSSLHDDGDGVDVAFSDGRTARYDCVIGADGVHSSVRAAIFGERPLRYSGLCGWAFWTPQIGNVTAREYYGNGKMIGLYGGKDVLCCFAILAAPAGTTQDATTLAEVRAHFAEMPESALAFFDRADQEQPLWRDNLEDLRLRRWSRGRVALLGDAAAPFLPTAGVGASMAIESSAVLAEELALSDSRLVTDAFARYEKRRRSRIDGIQTLSRRLVWLVSGKGVIAHARDAAFRFMSAKQFVNSFSSVFYTSV